MRVILLEDNAVIAETHLKHLRNAGFVTDHCETLDELDHFVDLVTYDILLLDRCVPDGDSRIWLERRRQAGDTTPALFLTVRDGISDRIEGLDSGADDYLPKPVAAAELEARIRAILRRPRPLADPRLVCGNLALDPITKAVEVDGRPIDISLREASLLEFLVRRPGLVKTRAAIEQQLYDLGQDVTPNCIEVCTCRLRKRLAASGARVEIHTVRGVGYLLRERAEPDGAIPAPPAGSRDADAVRWRA